MTGSYQYYNECTIITHYECHEKESCFGVSNIITSDQDNDIECYGYRSCMNVNIIQTSIADIYCSGSYSCYQSRNIKFIDIGSATSVYTIYCNGLRSCSDVYNISTLQISDGITPLYGGSVDCDGSMSCMNSNMYLFVSDTFYSGLTCCGFRSCANSYVESYSGNSVRIYGYLAAENATFVSKTTSITYTFYGVESGKNATIICEIGDTCSINCYSNACNTLTLQCADGNSSSCTFDIDCGVDGQEAEYSTICPNGYLLDAAITIPSFANQSFDNQFSTFENSHVACNDANLTNLTYSSYPVNCDDYRECTNQTLQSSIICCTAAEGCYQTLNISSAITQQQQDLEYLAAIRCDGQESCNRISGKIMATNGGSMYMTGKRASQSLSTMISTNTEYDIICSGCQSCVNVNPMTNANNIYCLSFASCYFANINENVNNVFAYGDFSAPSTNIYNVKDSIYCATRWSCQSSDINNVVNNVYGLGLEALYNAQISNVGNNVMVAGYRVLIFGDVSNVANVICIGYEACMSTDIANVTNIMANGYNVLSDATVVSNRGGLSFTIKINGTIDDDYEITCSINDTCFIYCESSDACTNLNLHCDGSCCVDCDESNGINCPSNVTGPGYTDCIFSNVVPTMNPSIHPTRITTQAPSKHPSSLPSSDPSNNPTSDPTNNPTSDPSNNPTINPSNNPTNNPTSDPTSDPTSNPTTMSPTQLPSNVPTTAIKPTINPTRNPSVVSTTSDPSGYPTMSPTHMPTRIPTRIPTLIPSKHPTLYTTSEPTLMKTPGKCCHARENTDRYEIYCNFNDIIQTCLELGRTAIRCRWEC